jgi:hypothetical protein
VATKRREPTEQEIAEKAYEISMSSESGTDEENWYRAEQELAAKPKPKAATTPRPRATTTRTASEQPTRTRKTPEKAEKAS